MGYDDIKNGRLHVMREKTKLKTHRAYLAIEISLDLNALINDARHVIDCPFIVHENPSRHNKNDRKIHWAQVMPDRLTKYFRIYRDKMGIFDKIPKEQRPSFHEIRALGGGHLSLIP